MIAGIDILRSEIHTVQIAVVPQLDGEGDGADTEASFQFIAQIASGVGGDNDGFGHIRSLLIQASFIILAFLNNEHKGQNG